MFAQTPVPMATQPANTYTEDFADIAAWTFGADGVFASGIGSAPWKGNASNATGTIPSATRMTAATQTFVSGSTGGVQRGTESLVFLTTGGTNNSSSLGFDLHLDFTGTIAGTISFDAATISNSTGDRGGSLRLYSTVNGTDWTEVTGTGLPYVAINNVSGSESITTVALPTSFNGASNAVLRFYYHNNGGLGVTGSRPKISIDNLSITSTLANSPILTPTPATLDFPTTNISTTSNALNFSLAGANLTNEVSLEVAAPFSISATENGTYGTTLTIPAANFSSNQTVYVRFSPTIAQEYTGSITINSTGATEKNVTLNGNGFDPTAPIVTPSITNLTFTGVPVGGESAIQTYTITANNLTADVNITAPTGFVVSADGTTFSNSITVSSSDPALATGKTISVKYLPTSVATVTGNITHSTTGGTTENVAVSGSGVGVINLTSAPYLQDFNSIGTGLPAGITGRSGASATNVGPTVLVYSTADAVWNGTGGGLKNFRSGVEDAAPTDRAFGFRQVGGTDPGAAYVFQISNTANKINFSLDFLLQSLDASSPRATTWRVDYGIGINPSSFIVAPATGNLTTGGNTFSVEPIHVDFGNALDDIADIVTIRIAAISGSTNTGNRPSTAIDDFTLNWQSPTDKTISTSVNSIVFPATNIGGQSTQTYTVNSTNLTDNLLVTATGAFTVSSDNSTFSNSVSVTPPNGTAATIYVRFSPTANSVFNGTLTHTSSDAFARTINVSGEGIDPNALAFNFNTCTVTSLPGSGFISINTTGAQRWGCSGFGRNSSNAVDVNGYANGAAQSNEAWLISPVLNLVGFANMPVLSFYSRGEFTGPLLKLFVTTNYDGVSAPTSATWTEITNANFPTPPGSATSAWTLSDNIDLSAYKGVPNVRIAFVYTSSVALGAARWSVDDIAITDQSSLITATPGTLSFGEVATGAQSAGQSVSFRAVGGSTDYTVTAPANYAVSSDNSTFTSSIVIPQATAAATTTFYVRFAPTVKALKLEGNVTITAPGVSKSVNVTGSSYPKAETLDIVTYNLSFFGSNDNNNATPAEVTTQVNNITTVLQRLDSDVIGFQEMSNDVALTTLVGNLPGYASVTAPKWSYSFNPPDPAFPPQKIGFIYNTNTMTLSTTEPPRLLFDQIYEDARLSTPQNPIPHPITGYPTGTASSFWGSGRLPYMATFNTNISGGVSETIRVVVLHAKSGSAIADYNRRAYDLQVLKDSLDAHYPTDKIVILGDYNDRLFGSIAVGSPSSYSMFLNDPARYNPLTLPLDQAGRTSFPSRGNLIDHLMVSNELAAQYIATSADIEDPRSYIAPYNATTASDHLPVFARFSLAPIALPVTFTHVQAIQKQKTVAVEWITGNETDNAYFIVERSSNGTTNFQSIGRVNGNGTTTVSHQYWYNDETPLVGNNYYRIKQVDIDGKHSYSKVVRVSFNTQSADKILISPNPVNRNIRLQLNNSTTVYQLQVFGVDGKMLLQNNGVEMQLNSYLNSEINKLSKGLYFIKVKSGDNTLTSKFVKE